jgi:hypothetical protein
MRKRGEREKGTALHLGEARGERAVDGGDGDGDVGLKGEALGGREEEITEISQRNGEIFLTG